MTYNIAHIPCHAIHFPATPEFQGESWGCSASCGISGIIQIKLFAIMFCHHVSLLLVETRAGCTLTRPEVGHVVSFHDIPNDFGITAYGHQGE